MNTEFGLKELYDLTLKATYPIELEGRIFEEGEIIARLTKFKLLISRKLFRALVLMVALTIEQESFGRIPKRFS